MHWRGARAVAAVAIMGALGATGRVETAPRETTGAACAAAVVVDEPTAASRLVCRPGPLARLLTTCPPDRAVHRGDRLRPRWQGGRCTTAVEQLPAAVRLRLGVGLDINVEPIDGLTRVVGIGPRTAERIVAGRPWASVEALDAVEGIGPARLARIAPALRASPRPPLWPSPPLPVASSPRRP